MLGLGHSLMLIVFRRLSKTYHHIARRFMNKTRLLTGYSDKRALELKARADALMVDHSVAHEVEIIEEAISVYEQVLQLRPMGHERRAEAVGDLGDALFHFCADNKIDDTRARRGVELLREAVLLTPPRHPSRDRALHRLARTMLFVMYQQSGDLNALSECMDIYREALQLRKAGHPERDDSLSNLAVALKWSFERCGDPTLMEECIRLSREVLDLRKPGNPRRDRALSNLATTLHLFVSLQGGMEMLAEADSLLREALELRPPGHPLRYGALDNLSGSLWTRYELQGLPETLSEVIALQREAIELLPTGHMYRGKVMNDLAMSLISDFRLRRDSSSLSEGIALARHVLSLRSPGHPDRHQSLSTLATALLAQFNERRDSACLKEAIDVRREALVLRPPGVLWRVETLLKLGELLCEPECCSGSEALGLFLEALKICPAGHHFRFWLLSGMSRCFLNPASPLFDLSTGISHLSEAYSDELTQVNQRLGEAVSDLRCAEMGYTEAMKNADASTRAQYSTRILDLNAQVLCLLPRAAHFGLNHKARLQVITGSDEIARNAAARALFLGRTSQAVELLEEGRGIFWSQTLHLRATGFDGVPANDREDLLRLLRMLEHGASTTERSDQTVAQREEDSERRRILDAQAQSLISKIRAYPGCTRFLLPATFETLMNGLPDGFVVIMNASHLGQHALLLHRVSGLAASLELKSSSTEFDFAALRARLPRDSNERSAHRNERLTRAMRLDNGTVHSFEDFLCQMWTSMVQPVIRQLGLQRAIGHHRPRLWWCVTGELSFLPMHAAGQYRGHKRTCTADYVVSSYIPTISSLTKARNGWKPIPRSSLAGLLVCETYADDGSLSRLPGSEEEACLVRGCFRAAQAQILNAHSPHTSIAELRSLLQGSSAHILHLACHGVQDADPLSSALLMQDGKLTIEDMLQLNMPNATLAYLSACQTAKGDQNAPDQAVHLAASMLFCGFRSVVGTMWLMHDEDGPKLARRFYDVLFAQEAFSLDDIAYALDEAVHDLRNQGVPAQRWAPFMHMGG